MTTKQCFRNKYRLEIREDDHLPMHVHLVGGNVDVLIDLEILACVGAFPRGLRAEVMAWVVVNRADLIEEWKNGIHETPPPAGRRDFAGLSAEPVFRQRRYADRG